jgi:acyl carrier protein
MMNALDEVIENMIRAVATEHKLRLPHLKKSTVLVEDLGFTSWTIVELFANLEEVLGVDPLYDDEVTVTSIRTIGDLCEVYESCLAREVSAPAQ